jgi:SAM-dependent methyltransferase
LLHGFGDTCNIYGVVMTLLSSMLLDQRHEKVAKYLQGDVLDIGCGGAQVLRDYSSSITSYCGIERTAEVVDDLSREFPAATFFQRDLDRERFGIEKKFDCVMLIAVIEHLFNQKFVMDGIVEVLKPGGMVLITTPTPFGNDFVHRIGAFVGLFAKTAVDDHIVIYNRHRFKILARETGLKLKHHRYFQFYCNQIAILKK